MTPRTFTDDKGHLWTLTGDQWIAGDLVVTTSGRGKARDFSPSRDPERLHSKLSVACGVEVRIAEAQRERVIAEMERTEREQEERDRTLAALDLARAIKAREREAAAESTRAAERKARAERRTALRVAAGLAVAGVVALLVCAGVWGVAL